MKSIEIKTTQNVSISYELASLGSRVMAWFIDLVIQFMAMVILSFLMGFLGIGMTGMYVYVYLLIMPVFFFYSLAWEWLRSGQSPGKMALRIRVIRADGEQLNLFDCLIRWSFRMVDIWLSLGAIAAVLINSTDRAQRLGGMLSNTVVVRLNSRLQINLDDILRIRSSENYSPSYPEIRLMNEEDMLVIKHLLERASKFPNTAHKQAINLAAERLRLAVGLDKTPENAVEFLNTCIRDYIVLTR